MDVSGETASSIYRVQEQSDFQQGQAFILHFVQVGFTAMSVYSKQRRDNTSSKQLTSAHFFEAEVKNAWARPSQFMISWLGRRVRVLAPLKIFSTPPPGLTG